MNLNKEDFEKIQNIRMDIEAQKVELSIGSFYVKYRKNYDINAFNEIIISKVASILGVTCPKYQIVIPKFQSDISENEYYMLSADLENIGPFLTAHTLGVGKNTNASVSESWEVLKEQYGSNSKLYKDLVATYLLSLFFGFDDFHNEQWGVIENNNEKRIAILDNEYSFVNNTKPEMSAFPTDIDYTLEVTLNRDINPLIINLKYFLDTFSLEYISLFESMYYLFTPEYLNKILNLVERDEVIITKNGNIPLKIYNREEILEKYKLIYADITKVWEDYQNTKKNKR